MLSTNLLNWKKFISPTLEIALHFNVVSSFHHINIADFYMEITCLSNLMMFALITKGVRNLLMINSTWSWCWTCNHFNNQRLGAGKAEGNRIAMYGRAFFQRILYHVGTSMLSSRGILYFLLLSTAFLYYFGHIHLTLPELPGWCFILFEIALTLFVQKKLLLSQPPPKAIVEDSSLAIRGLEALLQFDSTVATRRVKYSGDKNVPFTADEFRRWMRIVTEFTIDYYEHPEVYEVIPRDAPGFICNRLPADPPFEPEPFDNVIRDMYKIIMPGLNHWQHPRFHAYFAAGQSYPDIVAETLSSATVTVNFCCDSAPAYTELEIVMVNWVGKCFGLPKEFLFQGTNSETSVGGGSIKNAASDAILLAMIAVRRITQVCGSVDMSCRDKEHNVLKSLVAYSSTEAHSCVEKSALIALVHMRPVKADENFEMRGRELEKQVVKDIEKGNVPFFVLVTLGTTGTGAYDQLKEIVPVAKKYNLWIHVDASYGGNAWCCEEFRYQMEGIHGADSININLHKIFLHTSSATFFWTRNQRYIKESMNIEPAYLKASHENATDFRHWGIPLSRRSKCLKTWFVMRTYGLSGMQEYIRRLTNLTARFRQHLQNDQRVEIVGEQVFSLVCFKLKIQDLKESNVQTKALCAYINNSHRLSVTYASCNGISIIRISISFQRALEKETDESYEILSELIGEFLQMSQGTPRSPSAQLLYRDDPGVVGSPAMSTQSTLRSTASYTSLPASRTQASYSGSCPQSP